MDVEIGKVVGGWTVLGEGKTNAYVLCRCVCDTEKQVRKHDLLSGKSLMCRSCATSLSKQDGGKVESSELVSYRHMIDRCTNPDNKSYKDYGAKGITVCDLWLESFEAFLLQMGPKPEGYTIDRIDSTKGYYAENCKWSSRDDQNRNKGDNVRLTMDGETKTISEWARDERCKISQFGLYKRNASGKWDDHKLMITTPSKTDGDD